MSISITKLRANIYNILDEVIKTGKPVEITRAGKKLKIISIADTAQIERKLDKLIARHEAIIGSPEDFTHIDWSHEWKP